MTVLCLWRSSDSESLGFAAVLDADSSRLCDPTTCKAAVDNLPSTATTRTNRSDANDNEDKVGHDGRATAKPRLHHPAHKAKAHGGTLGRARYAFGHGVIVPPVHPEHRSRCIDKQSSNRDSGGKNHAVASTCFSSPRRSSTTLGMTARQGRISR